MFTYLIALTLFSLVKAVPKGNYVGCYLKSNASSEQFQGFSVTDCLNKCESLYYRYAVLDQLNCACLNIIKTREEEKSSCNIKCSSNNAYFCGGPNFVSIYDTGVEVPGPIRNPKVESYTDTILIIIWDKPDTGVKVAKYKITAVPIKTYSSLPLKNITWTAQDDRQKFELLNLHPATSYLIEILSLSESNEEGGSVTLQGGTEVGYPDPPPDAPKILEEKDNTIKIQINPVTNNNGPVSSFQIIVHFVDNELIQEFDETKLKGFQEAIEDGLPYYIAAEINAKNTTQIFTVGDNKQYGNYFNQELITDRHVHIILAVVSRLDNKEKVSYSEFAHNHLKIHEHHDHDNHSADNSGSDTLIIVLTVLCIVCGLLLIGSFIVYGYIRVKMGKRGSAAERHEMTMKGPILEVDNNGYISDSTGLGVNFKEQLQQALFNLDDDQKIIRRNLSLDIDSIIGIGAFGDIIQGRYNGNNENVPCQIHVVSDDMEKPTQVQFLRDLNHLLQFGFHKNMLNFMGVCQTNDWLYIIFEDVPTTLKHYLLNSRVDPNSNVRRLTKLSEDFILKILFDLCEVLEYMTYNKIVHRNLNSYNVRITRQNTIKLMVFGPTLYSSIETDNASLEVDDERYFAPEVMKFQNFSFKSMVYSWAIVGWEACCLGATPYGNIATTDLLPRIKKGFRPEQTQFIYDDLYQLFLNCWELDANERPTFTEIIATIKQLQMSPSYALNYNNPVLSVTLPHYLPLLEFKQ